MDAAFISTFSALAGAIIGGLTSFGTTWFTQRTQLREKDRLTRVTKLEALYNDFIGEAARLYADALTRQPEEPATMVPLYALGSRMQLVASQSVIDAAVRIDEHILETYLGPNRGMHEIRDVLREDGMRHLLITFSQACREDLAGRS